MRRIVIYRDVRRPRIFRGFVFHNAAAVVIFLDVRRIVRAKHNPQPAPLRDLSREKRESIEIVSHHFTGFHELRLSNRFPVARPHRIARQ